MPPWQMPASCSRASDVHELASSASSTCSVPNAGPTRSATNRASPRRSIAAATKRSDQDSLALGVQRQVRLVLDLMAPVHGDVAATRAVEDEPPHLDEELAVP